MDINTLLYAMAGLMLVLLILVIVLMVKVNRPKDDSALLARFREENDRQSDGLRGYFQSTADTVSDNTSNMMKMIGDMQKDAMQAGQNSIVLQFEQLQKSVAAQTQQMEQRIQNLERTNQEKLNAIEASVRESMKTMLAENKSRFEEVRKTLEERLQAGQKNTNDSFTQLQQGLASQMKQMEERLRSLEKTNEERLSGINSSLRENMAQLRQENSKKLDEIRGTVDEKLQTALEKRLTESFKSVSSQLEQVYTGLGEMKTLASDVGGLKKVLSGVKTRGILGEIQLGAILEELLTKDQYDTNAAVIPGSTERVEFAIKLPGSDGKHIYLPIDSKFPGERYQQLLEARESGSKEQEKQALRNLETVLCNEAKDIRDKYIAAPYTTNFGIMFLPFEGLYSEAVNLGLLEKLQRDFKVSIAGPSTMAALLNSLQMGFRTLAIQKRSNEVWDLLGAVKTEFGKYHEALEKMQKHLNQTSSDLDDLLGRRTNAVNRKLRSVEMLESDSASKLLELPEIVEGES